MKKGLWAAPASGLPVRLFASMPQQTEETRCRLSPGAHGWPKSALFCHAPTSTIYRIDLSGGSVAVFATLPERTVSDGALAFDIRGGFGFRLLAATGRSGSAADLTRYEGAVVVGSELQARFWVVRPRGQTFELVPLRTTLRGKHYNLDGATYLAP